MPNLEMRIEGINIRLRGASQEVARAATAGLGREMLEQLTQQDLASGGARALDLGSIRLGTVRSERRESLTQLTATLAHAITDAIEARLAEKRGG